MNSKQKTKTKKAWKKPTITDLSTDKTESGFSVTGGAENAVYYQSAS